MDSLAPNPREVEVNNLYFYPAVPRTEAMGFVAPTSEPSAISLSVSGLAAVPLLDPDLATAVAPLQNSDGDVPRDQVTVPICAGAVASDSVLFEDHADAAVHYYLPRYRLGSQMVSGREEYRISLEGDGQGWALVLYLEKYPAPELDVASRQAKEIPHNIAIILKYQIADSGGAFKELSFQEIQFGTGGLQAALKLNSLSERDEVYQALTNSSYDAQLTVRRVVRLATTVDFSPKIQEMDARIQDLKQHIIALENELQAVTTDRDHFPDWKFELMHIMQALNNLRSELNAVESERATIPSVPIFHEQNHTFDNLVPSRPFVFPPDLHPYIFSSITPGSAEAAGLIRWQVFFQNTFYAYYQERARPYIFYYLPDGFKLARQPHPPYSPLLSVRVFSPDGTNEHTQVIFIYVAVPFNDASRLAAAKQELRQYLPPTLPNGITEPMLLPLMTSNLQFLIERPQTPGSTVEERKTASVVLRSGIHDTLTMTREDFDMLFDAMLGLSASSFHGKIIVDGGQGVPDEIPFTAQLDDLVGELFEYMLLPDQESGGLQVTLKNAIEGPLRIARLTATLRRGDVPVAAELRGLSLPVERLNAGEAVTCTVVPQAPMDGNGELTVQFDLGGVDVLPDKEAIWYAIVDRTVLAYRRIVTVKAVAALFAPPDGRPNDTIVSIIVAFERGETVELTDNKLEAQARVDYPIDDVILRRPIEDWYRYRVTIIRQGGQQTQDSQPRTGNAELFYVEA